MSMNDTIIQNHILDSQGAYPPLIKDKFGRTFDYLRIAINEKCNLRCIYCMPEEGIPFKPSNELLNTEEIKRIVKISVSLGVKKVRFTGGEPLLRKDIFELIQVVWNLTFGLTSFVKDRQVKCKTEKKQRLILQVKLLIH